MVPGDLPDLVGIESDRRPTEEPRKIPQEEKRDGNVDGVCFDLSTGFSLPPIRTAGHSSLPAVRTSYRPSLKLSHYGQCYSEKPSGLAQRLHHYLRPKGVEMKREMTKEDKELAAANFLTDTNTRERTAANQTSGTLTFMKISLDLSSSARLLTPILTRRIQHTLMA